MHQVHLNHMQWLPNSMQVGKDWAYTIRATNHDGHNHDGHKVYHDGHGNKKHEKLTNVLLKNRQIHDIVSKLCLWSSWFVAVMVVAIIVIVCARHGCGHHSHCLWPSLFVAVIVIVCGRHCRTPQSTMQLTQLTKQFFYYYQLHVSLFIFQSLTTIT